VFKTHLALTNPRTPNNKNKKTLQQITMTDSTNSTNQIQKKTLDNMDAFIKAHELNGSNITLSCQNVGIDRGTYYVWMSKYPKFASNVKQCIERVYDFVEGSIHKGIREGNTAMTIFYAKTKMKGRGYVEKQEIEHSGSLFNQPVKIEIVEDDSRNDDEAAGKAE